MSCFSEVRAATGAGADAGAEAGEGVDGASSPGGAGAMDGALAFLAGAITVDLWGCGHSPALVSLAPQLIG